jgi:hypothetical protein
LSIDEPRGQNADGTGAALRVVTARYAIHGVAELHAVAYERGHLIRERHRERAADANASVTSDDRRPGTRSHRAAFVDNTALDAYREIGGARVERGLRALRGPSNGFRISLGLVPDAGRDRHSFYLCAAAAAREDSDHRGDLHGVGGPDDDSTAVDERGWLRLRLDCRHASSRCERRRKSIPTCIHGDLCSVWIFSPLPRVGRPGLPCSARSRKLLRQC